MLELNRISAGYGKQTVLNDVSAFFEKGKLTSIIGVNGCGKSTLLKAILGILPLSGGEITVDGENLLTMSRNEIAKKIAYLSQGKNTP
ncbi:MAG: ABC transporter ATP-binding protein, partial [Eubacteriales bacterium]|nr:ABC transporter ATP-binding protein [Eubacteriales bacterium]